MLDDKNDKINTGRKPEMFEDFPIKIETRDNIKKIKIKNKMIK